jgi:hypothetical protein
MTKLGHLLYTYSNVDDARIQQEISKQLYAERFDGVQLVHTYTGKPEWGYEQYLEDELIVMENRGHFRGAADHLAAGLRYFMEHGDQDVRYVLVAAADSWILDAAYLQKIIKTMERDGQVLAVSSWFSAYPEDIQGFSTDLFVVDIQWARTSGMFPLDFDSFYARFADVYALQGTFPYLERAFHYYFMKWLMGHYHDYGVRVARDKLLLRITSREPINDSDREYNRSNIGIFTSPDPSPKQAALKKLHTPLGKHAEKLKRAHDLRYYNLGRDITATPSSMATI